MISILGIPYDDGSSFLKGCCHAPAVIRNAFRSPSSNTTSECGTELLDHPKIADVGDLDLGSGQNARDQIESAIKNQVHDGKKVLSLGGDHSVTYPILKGFASKFGKLNVLHLDAHPDLYDELDGQRFSHASPFARALEDGVINRLVQVGIRTMNATQQEMADKHGVEVISMRDYYASTLEFDGPIYVTLDLDVLDPAYAPGISHYEPGGLTTREVLQVLEEIEVPILGADIVELNPTRDFQDQTAMVAAKLMKELLSHMLAK